MNITRLKMAMDGRFLMEQDHVIKLDLEEETRVRMQAGIKTMKSLRQLNDELDIQIQIGKRLLADIRGAL